MAKAVTKTIKKVATKKAATKSSKKVEEEKELCFVMMPFGKWFDSYYTDIYKPAILEAGLHPKRADDLYRPSSIVQDIWTYTKESKIVLADLTDKNPNVFYELGLAHALAKPAILITNSISDIPFDLRALRILDYDKNDPNWGILLKEKIVSAIKETIDSPITSVLPAFLNIKETDKTTITITENDFINLKKDMEIIRNELRHRSVESSIPSISMSEAEKLIASYIERGYPRSIVIRNLQRRGVPTGWTIKRLDSFSKNKGNSSSGEQPKES